MSQQALAEFIKALPENPTWAERLKDAVAVHDGADAINAVARVASDAGYDVTAGEAAAFRLEALKVFEDGELDEESLDDIAGGIIGVDDILIGAVALGGAGVFVAASTAVEFATIGGAAGGLAFLGNKDFRDGVTNFFSKW